MAPTIAPPIEDDTFPPVLKRLMVWTPTLIVLGFVSLFLGRMIASAFGADGLIVLQVSQPRPKIVVDGSEIAPKWRADGLQADVPLAKGSRTLQLHADGFKPMTATVKIERGDRHVVKAEFKAE